MVATDNQILMAAATVAGGIMADPRSPHDLKIVAEYSVRVVQAIAAAIPDDASERFVTDEQVAEIITKYAKAFETTPMAKLSSLIATGEGMTAKKAMNIVYRAEYLKLIENIGTGIRAEYVLR